MIKEIERKYVLKTFPKNLCSFYEITSGYTSKETSSRVNYIRGDNFEEGFVTFKSKGTLSRDEYEYSIPASEAFSMVRDSSICPFVIKKKRYEYNYEGNLWEIDVYENIFVNGEQLIVAEIEIQSEDYDFNFPEFIDKKNEVTSLKGISNHKLAVNGLEKTVEDNIIKILY